MSSSVAASSNMIIQPSFFRSLGGNTALYETSQMKGGRSRRVNRRRVRKTCSKRRKSNTKKRWPRSK